MKFLRESTGMVVLLEAAPEESTRTTMSSNSLTAPANRCAHCARDYRASSLITPIETAACSKRACKRDHSGEPDAAASDRAPTAGRIVTTSMPREFDATSDRNRSVISKL